MESGRATSPTPGHPVTNTDSLILPPTFGIKSFMVGPQQIRDELICVDHWSNPHSFCVHFLLRTFGIPVAYTENCMCLALLSHPDVVSTCLSSVSLLSSLTQWMCKLSQSMVSGLFVSFPKQVPFHTPLNTCVSTEAPAPTTHRKFALHHN